MNECRKIPSPHSFSDFDAYFKPFTPLVQPSTWKSRIDDANRTKFWRDDAITIEVASGCSTDAECDDGVLGIEVGRLETAVGTYDHGGLGPDSRPPHDDQHVGINILRRAIEEPLRQIVRNAGEDASVVLNAVAEGKGNFGYNAATGEYGDMIEAGILDPTKVTRYALQNAASVSGLLLTTEAMVTDAPKDAPDAPPMPDMGGMGGMM